MTAVIALTEAGAALARRLALTDARLHGLAGRVGAADLSFAEVGAHLRGLFAAGTPIVLIGSAGIAIRALASILADKRQEPPVVAVAEDGSAVVPLLGGHRGANVLAWTIAGRLGIAAATTTASDVSLGFALDAPPPGWRIANPDMAKPVAAALLAGEPVRLEGEADWIDRARFAGTGRLAVIISDRAAHPDDALVLHAPMLALGVGSERDAPVEELETVARRALVDAGLAVGAVACVASLDLKADEPAVLALAARLGVPARFFSASELEKETPRLANPSETVFREVGCHGVAEGAALAAAGADAALVVAKVKGTRCTVAVARAPRPIDAGTVGRARGRLSIVGIGPGAAAWRTPEVDAALAGATQIVGYDLYLDLLGPTVAHATQHRLPLGAEEERARLALDLAATGQSVVLVSSGDAGIYGLAALAMELLDRADRADWNRVEIAVLPGLSALQAAAARAGAPLGHDFAAVSLSDLMTPWEVIERRLYGAAVGGFVVALYNPASARRRTQLGRALEILAEHRAPETPVVIARNLGRADEAVEIATLTSLDPDRIDMLTLLLVGSPATRIAERGRRRWVYTPRGYLDRSKHPISEFETTKDTKEESDRVGKAILDAAFRVHTTLGPGLLASAYEAALAYEIATAGLGLRRQAALPLVYKGVRLDAGFRVDLLVQEMVAVKLKAVDALTAVHAAQVLSYLKIGGWRLGYLLNFNTVHLKDGIRRIVND
jgi:cobalt-precorrin 5A hydrolase/precorrin-3B C17-methyltransferase